MTNPLGADHSLWVLLSVIDYDASIQDEGSKPSTSTNGGSGLKKSINKILIIFNQGVKERPYNLLLYYVIILDLVV